MTKFNCHFCRNRKYKRSLIFNFQFSTFNSQFKMKYIAISIFCILFSSFTWAQNNGSDIVAKAIKEEVDRGIKGLKAENSTPPFFISYTMADQQNFLISASLGSLVQSTAFPSRMSNIRLLMGNHQCTDENFSGGSYGAGQETYDGQPCMENNEEGIRYTVWRDIDAVYKSASKSYEEKLLALKQMDIPEKYKNLPDWDKSPAVQMNNIPYQPVDLNKEKYENYVKEASKVFADYKDILVSKVSVEIKSYLIYFYNTEGTEYRLPASFVSLSIAASAKDKEEEPIAEFEFFNYSSDKDLPSLEKLKEVCKSVADKIILKRNAPKVAKTYTGPVLFENYAVADVFYSNFFDGSTPFISRRTPISAFGYSYDNEWEEKIGTKITNKSITIEDLTGTKEYKGQKLLGYVPVDAEGVVPAEKLMLVEKGMLKNLLGTRVPTETVKQSNGHQLYNFSGGVGYEVASGVIRFSDSRTSSLKKMKKELLKRAQKEGYDYAYIVRKSSAGGRYPMEFYKVNVADGSEEYVRSGVIDNINMQSFKSNIVSVSDEEYIYNGFASTPISIITPTAVLFDELDVQKEQINKYQKPSKVPPPYKTIGQK